LFSFRVVERRFRNPVILSGEPTPRAPTPPLCGSTAFENTSFDPAVVRMIPDIFDAGKVRWDLGGWQRRPSSLRIIPVAARLRAEVYDLAIDGAGEAGRSRDIGAADGVLLQFAPAWTMACPEAGAQAGCGTGRGNAQQRPDDEEQQNGKDKLDEECSNHEIGAETRRLCPDCACRYSFLLASDSCTAFRSWRQACPAALGFLRCGPAGVTPDIFGSFRGSGTKIVLPSLSIVALAIRVRPY